jgi:hypothetical protein
MNRNAMVVVAALALVALALFYVAMAERSYAECLESAGNHVMLCQMVRPLWR